MLDSDATGFEEVPSFLESRDSLAAWTFQSADDGGSNASVAIIDAQLLFHADFKRTGDDLTLIGSDGSVHVVAGYFKSDVLATMQSPNGASLKGDVIAALAGPRAAGQYASATKQESSAQAIGQVAKLEGHATVIRNGVAIVLNVGDAVLKGDVVQTGSSGTIGILFKDGSVFQITPDSRLVLSDFAYDANGSANIEEFNLVQDSFSFVSGAIAKLGNMRIGTPVATMKIYGNGDDDVIMGGAGDDYLDGGTGNNKFQFNANDGHDTVVDSAGGTRQIVVSGNPLGSHMDSLDVTHLGSDGLQITYGQTVIDVLNYSDTDSFSVGFAFENPLPYIYRAGAVGTNWFFHRGVDGTDSHQLLVGTDGADHINAVGFGNLMFGGDGNDVITGGNALANVDPYALGGSDIYVGGKGDDMLISYGVGDPNAGPFSNIYATETYVFNVGDGQDTIDDRGGGNPQSSLYADRIIIDTKGAALTSFSASHDPSAASGGNDLVINYSSTDSISETSITLSTKPAIPVSMASTQGL